MEIVIKKTAKEVAESFANLLAEECKKTKNPFHLALSGGSTPKAIFDYIVTNTDIVLPWERIHLWWGDERCVAPEHEESNFNMTKKHLLQHIAIPEANIHRIIGEAQPEEEVLRYQTEIKELVPIQDSMPIFNLVMLGMGDDGHTLSIFPHEAHLIASHDICVKATHPTSGQIRVSLSINVVNKAEKIVFLVTGANKADKVNQIIRRNGAWKEYPASYIEPADGKLYWLMDETAAVLLK